MAARNITTKYEVTITCKVSWEEDVEKNLLVEKIPTGKKSDDYGSKDLFHEKYAVTKMAVVESNSTEVFSQQIDGDAFDLKRVILAINNIDEI